MAKRKSKQKENRAKWWQLMLLGLLIAIPIVGYFVTRADKQPQTVDSSRSDSLTSLISPLLFDTIATYNKIGVYVYDLTEEQVLYNHLGTEPMIPASCIKLLTAAASYKYLGLDYAFADSLFISGKIDNGTLKGDVYFKADYDPLFVSFDSLLIHGLKERSIEKIDGNVIVHLPVKPPFDYHNSWAANDIKEKRMPLLMKGDEVVRKSLVDELKKQKIVFTNKAVLGDVPLHSDCVYATQHTIREVLVPVLLRSNNILAELLFSRLSTLGEGSNIIYRFMEEELHHNNLEFTVNDGSGLSVDNRVSAQFLCDVLHYAFEHKELFDLFISKGLPKSGDPEQRGTLGHRMEGTIAEGRIWGKTGTLPSKGAFSRAGYCHGINNHWYAYAVLSEGANKNGIRALTDSVCIKIAGFDY